MFEDIFDAIIVGAGLAGSVAALGARPSKVRNVLVIVARQFRRCQERHRRRLYAHSLEHIIPGFADSAPVERLITL